MSFAPIAQLVEQRFCKPSVAGSIPAGRSIMGLLANWISHLNSTQKDAGSSPAKPASNRVAAARSMNK